MSAIGSFGLDAAHWDFTSVAFCGAYHRPAPRWSPNRFRSLLGPSGPSPSTQDRPRHHRHRDRLIRQRQRRRPPRRRRDPRITRDATSPKTPSPASPATSPPNPARTLNPSNAEPLKPSPRATPGTGYAPRSAPTPTANSAWPGHVTPPPSPTPNAAEGALRPRHQHEFPPVLTRPAPRPLQTPGALRTRPPLPQMAPSPCGPCSSIEPSSRRPRRRVLHRLAHLRTDRTETRHNIAPTLTITGLLPEGRATRPTADNMCPKPQRPTRPQRHPHLLVSGEQSREQTTHRTR